MTRPHTHIEIAAKAFPTRLICPAERTGAVSPLTLFTFARNQESSSSLVQNREQKGGAVADLLQSIAASLFFFHTRVSSGIHSMTQRSRALSLHLSNLSPFQGVSSSCLETA